MKNSITGLFKSKGDENPSDHLIITISQVDPKTKERKVISEGHGSWVGQVYIDSKK